MAYGQNNISQYQKNAINTASPLQLVIMLYDGCLRFISASKGAMEREDIFNQNENSKRAQNILTELMSTLDMERGGEVAQNLFQLYNYAYDQLIEGNINDDKAALDRASKVLDDLRSSWAELDRQQRESKTGGVVHAA